MSNCGTCGRPASNAFPCPYCMTPTVDPRPLAPGDTVQLAEAGTVNSMGSGRYVEVDFPSIGTQWVKRDDLVRVAAGEGERDG